MKDMKKMKDLVSEGREMQNKLTKLMICIAQHFPVVLGGVSCAGCINWVQCGRWGGGGSKIGDGALLPPPPFTKKWNPSRV